MLENNMLPIHEAQPSDLFICAYPRSGVTWFQNFLAGVIFGIDPENSHDALIQDLVPDIHYKHFYKRYGTVAYFKTHNLPQKNYRRVVYLLRDGRDVMVSYYHFLTALHGKIDFLKLVRGDGHPVGFWHKHVESWLSNPFQAEMMVIKYEALKALPLRELTRFCSFAGLDRDESELERIISKASFDRAQKKEKLQGWDNKKWPSEHAFIRRGKVGSFNDEMPDEVLSAFLQVAGPTLMRQGYLSAQNHEDHSPNTLNTPESFEALRTQNIEKMIGIANDWLNKGQDDRALHAFERVISLRPDQPNLRYGKAIALTRLGQNAEAIELLKGLLAIAPGYTEAEGLLKSLGENSIAIP